MSIGAGAGTCAEATFTVLLNFWVGRWEVAAEVGWEFGLAEGCAIGVFGSNTLVVT